MKVTMRSLKQEKASAFDRLDRPDNTQVSSSPCSKLGLHRSGLFYIRYPVGYPVSFAGYPAGLIAGYPAEDIKLQQNIYQNLFNT